MCLIHKGHFVKKLLSMMVFALIFSVSSMRADIWKYFTTAYWLPYTNGNQLELDERKKLKREIKKENEKKLEQRLKGNGLRTFYIAKIVKAQTKQGKQPFWSAAYWLPYTSGNQFKIEDLDCKKSKVIDE